MSVVCRAPKAVDPTIAVVARQELSAFLLAQKRYGYEEDKEIDGEIYRFRYAEHPPDAGISTAHPGVDYLECGAVCLARGVLDEARVDLGSTNDWGIPNAFCAAAVTDWMKRASVRTGIKSPVPGSTGARHLGNMFQSMKLWVSIDDLRKAPDRVRPGMVFVATRDDPKLERGHTGIVETVVRDGVFGTIEANATSQVARFQRRLDNASLLGMGYFPCASDGGDGPSALTLLGITAAVGLGTWGVVKLLGAFGAFR